jgi:hypothetical protein
VATLSSAQLSSFAPYTQLARAAYCAPARIKAWSCGREHIPVLCHELVVNDMFAEACSAILGFNVTLNGGDGAGVQYCAWNGIHARVSTTHV